MYELFRIDIDEIEDNQRSLGADPLVPFESKNRRHP